MFKLFKRIFIYIFTKIYIYIEHRRLLNANKKRHQLRITEIGSLIEKLRKHEDEYNSRLIHNGGNGNILWCTDLNLNKKARSFLKETKELWNGYEFKFPVGEISTHIQGNFDILFNFPYYDDKGIYNYHRLTLAFKKNEFISNGYILEEDIFVEYKNKLIKINTAEDFTYAIQAFCFDQLLIEYKNKLLIKTFIDLE